MHIDLDNLDSVENNLRHSANWSNDAYDVTFSLTDKDQLTTDTADLKMTKDALAEDTTAFEDTTQDCLVCQTTKVADFEVYTNKSLSEELEALVKAKILISEKTDDAEYRDNRSVLSSHGGLVRELIKSENSIELVQIASRIDSAMHDEISNGDDPFAKFKGLISDMITRSEEKASADDTHNANHKASEAKQISQQLQCLHWCFLTCIPFYVPVRVETSCS